MATALAALCAAAAVLLVPYALRLARYIGEVLRRNRLTRDVPGPRVYPVVGSLPAFLALMRDPHDELRKLLDKYGSTVRLPLLDRTLLVVMEPDDLQVVCTHPALATKPVEYARFLGSHIGQGLLNINEPLHRRHRKAITPSLHLDILHDFVAVFAKQAEVLADRVDERAADGAPGEVFNVQPEFGRMAGAALLQTVLTAPLHNMTEAETAAHVDALNETNLVIVYRALRPWWTNDTVFRLLSNQAEKFMRTAAAMESMVCRVLNAKTAELSAGLPPPPRRRMAFLDHMLRSKESEVMSRAELRDELKTFLFVGSSTSMDLMSLITLAMAMYGDVQRRVHQELDEVFGAPGTPGWDRPVVPEDLAHLAYLERTIKEVLRYAPPVPFVFRIATDDVRLPSGTLVPRGAYVGMVPAGTHRLERHFPDPYRFDPDRFLPENSAGRHPYAFVPFSAGSRNCIGMRYALMLAKTATATLLRRFAVHTAPGGPRGFHEVSVDTGATIMVRGGVQVRLQRRAPRPPGTPSPPTPAAH
ncbi:hypothetical protein ONE63_003014 [Megalurothrips usitatus]|uniref:Cytochrome P450 4C1-like n=1 Tax=Megalurothrips usitatus TaxID=439358 RepID=A0AAV7X608_9NEOP|nr:hypothetical protein ONE63_003014 [Megalurothrips usitatus]